MSKGSELHLAVVRLPADAHHNARWTRSAGTSFFKLIVGFKVVCKSPRPLKLKRWAPSVKLKRWTLGDSVI
jgi:hypothetical protein